jgi:predicted  nucleic acid-binding Zn-ribbon protein
MSALARLLDLQEVDTRLAQLRHRVAHLPESAEVDRLRSEITRVDAALRTLDAEGGELANLIAAAEARSTEIRSKSARLNAQLKTVIAPREAEALQHEIATLATEASELDDSALVALEKADALASETLRTREERASLEGALAAAEGLVRDAAEVVRSEMARIEAQRAALINDVEASLLAAYEKRRSMHGGVAVARLSKATCGGCHIDLSTTEIEVLKKSEESERECPNCARWLVL